MHTPITENSDPLRPGEIALDECKSFWRHRKDADYVVRGRKIYRMGDGLLFRACSSEKQLKASVKFLEGGKRPMRVKVL